MGKKPIAEEKIRLICELVAEGLSSVQVAEKTGVNVNTVRKYITIYRLKQKNPELGELLPARTSSEITKEIREFNAAKSMAEKQKPAELVNIPQPTAKQPAAKQPTANQPPADLEEVKKQTFNLSTKLLKGAEKLADSIADIDAETLAFAPLNHRATALGILVDKLQVITNQANPMFGANGGTINVINVIAASTPPRRKGSDNNPDTRTAAQQIEDADILDNGPEED